MTLRKAVEADFVTVRAFYDAVIDGTKGMKEHAKWKKGSHPFDDTILGYIRQGDFYLCFEGDTLISVFALPFSQQEDYRAIAWNIPCAEDEAAVLHIFAVSPAVQGKGYGKKVLGLAAELAKKGGMKAFRIDVLETNTPAIKLYEALDFTRVGKQTLYTDNAGMIGFFYYEKPIT